MGRIDRQPSQTPSIQTPPSQTPSSPIGFQALLASLFFVLVAAASGCGKNDNPMSSGNPPGGTGGRSNSIDIVMGAQSRGAGAFSPNPDTISLTANPTITWRNTDSATHTVTSNNGTFTSSGNIAPNGTHSAMFLAPGSYLYHCSIAGHNMTGTIVVEP